MQQAKPAMQISNCADVGMQAGDESLALRSRGRSVRGRHDGLLDRWHRRRLQEERRRQDQHQHDPGIGQHHRLPAPRADAGLEDRWPQDAGHVLS